jgi:alanine dehydrogenase
LNAFSGDRRAGGTRILTRRDVAALLTMDDCIAAVEEAFRLHAEGRTLGPGVLGVPATDGGFHIKAAGLRLDRAWFAVKCNGNFFRNMERFGMPNIQGVILLCDGDNGLPLAVLDSIEITILRTGAATAVAARRLARPDARVATICGCGNQGRAQLRALSRVLPLRQIHAFDADPARAAAYAAEMSAELGVSVECVESSGALPAALRASDVCVTCTPARSILVRREDISPGAFVAGVGADASDKQEIDPRLFEESRVVVDSLEQCASFGDLRHALESGGMTRARVHAELAEVVAGRKPGRTSADEITLFDSTGVALEDVAAAVAVYRRAEERSVGTLIDLGGFEDRR